MGLERLQGMHTILRTSHPATHTRAHSHRAGQVLLVVHDGPISAAMI